MNDKLKDVRGKKPTEDEIVNYEETKEPELVPDGETQVPTGDEDMPLGATDPKEARKALYDKARKNREKVMREDADGAPDVERLQRLQEEAAGGERPEEGLDTNRKDRFEEEQAIAEAMEKGLRKTAETLDEGQLEEESTKETSRSADDALTERDPDAKVTVKILGKEYSVPQQDIDDAGGIEIYQKSRAATMRLQRIATLEKALPAEPESGEAREEQQEADPSTDGLDEADISSLREKLLDALANGDDLDEFDEQLKKAVSRPPSPKPKQTEQRSEVGETERQIIEEAQRELAAQLEDDRVAANNMMRKEYSDIMGDPELLALAQQRYSVVSANPENFGRTQKELARESAEYVRSLGKRLLVQPNKRSELEDERQRRILRKKRLPQASRADAPAPQPQTDERKIPSRKEHLARLRRRAGLDLPE